MRIRILATKEIQEVDARTGAAMINAGKAEHVPTVLERERSIINRSVNNAAYFVRS